jgi:ribonucleoside-triphosphate reductase
MDQLNQDFVTQTEKPTGVLQNASKRVRMIFSVMASPNRIDILRILNAKGPLTYSELKSLAGFKSKKESGKFAYHLRKLLRQSLVALNKAERKYTITNLGKLVLSLSRQIEERAIVESGKMYVRTSRHSIEEFNSNRIIQSLVREANMPIDQAHKITEEVENKVYKFQTAYLTSSLIRETVNSILIEHGHEEYRSKLARLGLPASDVMELLNDPKNEIDNILTEASMAIFSENLLFNSLAKDITDMHLSGELNISNTGLWNLIPDVIFFDARNVIEGGFNTGGKNLSVSRIYPVKKLEDFISLFPIITSSLSREASGEIILDYLLASFLNKVDCREGELESVISLGLIAASRSHDSLSAPNITLNLFSDDIASNTIESILGGYKKYVECTQMPKIGLSFISKDLDSMQKHTKTLTKIMRNGGIIGLSKINSKTQTGVRKVPDGDKKGTTINLQSLSINLPRLAHQSNKDETYFRARLALMLKPAVISLSLRKKIISDNIRRNMLPCLSQATESLKLGKFNMLVNLTGLHESVFNILGYESNGFEIMQKIIRTSVDIASDLGKEMEEEFVTIGMITDDSPVRLASLDLEKYGKMQNTNQNKFDKYSQGISINGLDLLNNDNELIENINNIDNLLNGGLSIFLSLTNLNESDSIRAVNEALKLNFFKSIYSQKICNLCGLKLGLANDICASCNSTNLRIIN